MGLFGLFYRTDQKENLSNRTNSKHVSINNLWVKKVLNRDKILINFSTKMARKEILNNEFSLINGFVLLKSDIDDN